MEAILQLISIFCCATVVSGLLKCYTCNDVHHAHICKENTTLAPADSQHVTECKGTCFIGKISNDKISVLRRGCNNNYQIEITEILNTDEEQGFKCHCNTDFCNINLNVCSLPVPAEVRSTASMMSIQFINLFIFLNAMFTLLIFI